jgi:hypothetical protein
MLSIGCGAGFGGDRADAAIPVVETLIARGGPSVLMYEVLAERTLALAQLAKRRDPAHGGYAPMMEAMLSPVLRRCLESGIPIVSNFGAANPRAAALRIREMAAPAKVKVAVVEGDDLSGDPELLRAYLPESEDTGELIAANVYLGAEAIAGALRAGAQVVVTGRVADPALALGPAMSHFGWRWDDWDALARATMAGHLLECGAQVTGGYFAEPGVKDVPRLWNAGFPIAELEAHGGSFVITKAEGTGGLVDCRTVKEQLLYEVHDPAAYMTPDVVADITDVSVHQAGEDRVEIRGVRGHARPSTLKALGWFPGGWLAEGEISYAGWGAGGRATMARMVLEARLCKEPLEPLRFDLIGTLSVFGDDLNEALVALAWDREYWQQPRHAREVRLRAAASHRDRAVAERLIQEVTALYTCGPAGGGGIRTNLTQRLRSVACLLPRDMIRASFEVLD